MADVRSWQYSANARRDIKDILDRTDDEWGVAQMVTYGRMVHAAILLICRHPESGHTHADLPKNYRICPVGSHLIIYRRKRASLVIVRILHQAMNLQKHV
ncbi:MAG: type II toxin-antitoxin system RelE/ParE family toxin [Asticcacaulis sp.]